MNRSINILSVVLIFLLALSCKKEEGGLFFKPSPEDTGVDFANREAPPKPGEEGFYLAFAVAFRYEHGKGQLAGIRFPNSFPDPSSRPGQLNLVDVTVNQLGVNLAVKASF